MITEDTFLSALRAAPTDELTWLALADWLDDDGQSDRAELLRGLRRLSYAEMETQERAAGVGPGESFDWLGFRCCIEVPS
jgi:uncharacterized protein (TIGR02996 family)